MNDEVGSAESVSITDAVEKGEDASKKTFSTKLK